MAVTWLKPLRENERTFSTPFRPDNAVSIGKVTRFSISTGLNVGTTVLICTCLLVMSGVTSIGSKLSCHAPIAATMQVKNMTSQRDRTEPESIASIITIPSRS
jgi:hypothetical protein